MNGGTLLEGASSAKYSVVSQNNGEFELKPEDGTITPIVDMVGYDFDKWIDNSGEELSVDSVYEGNTYSATWKPSEFLVDFDANGGSVTPENKNVVYDSAYGELPIPTRTGYSFTGWFLDINRIIGTTIVQSDGNHTLKAHWNPNTYRVNFDANGGTVSASFIDVVYDSTYGSFPTVRRNGYTFAGWFDTDDNQVLETDIYTIANDTTLYAKWNPITYTITFDSTGGSNSIPSKDVVYDDTYGELPIPTKTGHTFLGWYTNVTSGTQVTDISTVKILSDTTLYAHWSDHVYSSEVVTNATCTSKGTHKYTCVCGYYYTSADIPALGHVSVNGGTSGVHSKCSRCGVTLSSTHSYTSTVVTNATCTTVGTHKYTCSCGYSYTANDIPALGHSSAYGGTSGVHTKCSRCGVTLSTTHSYSSSVYIAATCTVKGTTKYTCACGYSYTSQNIAALGHTFPGWSYNASEHYYYCGRGCGTLVDRGGHGAARSEIIQYQSCTRAEVTKYYCGCGYSWTANTKNAAGHSHSGSLLTDTEGRKFATQSGGCYTNWGMYPVSCTCTYRLSGGGGTSYEYWCSFCNKSLTQSQAFMCNYSYDIIHNCGVPSLAQNATIQVCPYCNHVISDSSGHFTKYDTLPVGNSFNITKTHNDAVGYGLSCTN